MAIQSARCTSLMGAPSVTETILQARGPPRNLTSDLETYSDLFDLVARQLEKRRAGGELRCNIWKMRPRQRATPRLPVGTTFWCSACECRR